MIEIQTLRSGQVVRFISNHPTHKVEGLVEVVSVGILSASVRVIRPLNDVTEVDSYHLASAAELHPLPLSE